jgi:hypothetical protein
MATFWAYRRILGVGVGVAALGALYITVIAPAAFAPGGGRPFGDGPARRSWPPAPRSPATSPSRATTSPA